MNDRTTKALLFAIALGLWANLAAGWLRPVAVQAQDLSSVESNLPNIDNNLGRIQRATCANSTIC